MGGQSTGQVRGMPPNPLPFPMVTVITDCLDGEHVISWGSLSGKTGRDNIGPQMPSGGAEVLPVPTAQWDSMGHWLEAGGVVKIG